MTISKKRNRHSAAFKAKVAIEALKNEKTISELAAEFCIHPTMVTKYKRDLIEGAVDIFDKNHKSQKQTKDQIDNLYRQIGRLQVERDFLSKKLSL